MRESPFLSEEDLARLERRAEPESISHLVSMIRQQQHELDSLRLGVDVARRDREELRMALMAAQAEIHRLRAAAGAGAPNPSHGDET